jgi:hypothetical protein
MISSLGFPTKSPLFDTQPDDIDDHENRGNGSRQGRALTEQGQGQASGQAGIFEGPQQDQAQPFSGIDLEESPDSLYDPAQQKDGSQGHEENGQNAQRTVYENRPVQTDNGVSDQEETPVGERAFITLFPEGF